MALPFIVDMDPPEHAPQSTLPVQDHEHVALPCLVDMDPPEHAPQPPLPVQDHGTRGLTLYS